MAKPAVLFLFLMLVCLMVLNVKAQPVKDDQSCICVITRAIEYVCGSDGIDYNNKSMLDCAAKCKRSEITIRSEGKCDGSQ